MMAMWVRNSANIMVNHFKSKMGSLGMTNFSSWSSSFTRTFPVVPASFGQNHRIPVGDFSSSPAHFRFCSRRFESGKAETLSDDGDANQVLDLPEGKVKFSHELRFISESAEERESCYRVLDDNGKQILPSSYVEVSPELSVKMYSEMVMLQTMDNIFYEAQRQGRISFYVTTAGEEAINIASAAALTFDDIVLPQIDQSDQLHGVEACQLSHIRNISEVHFCLSVRQAPATVCQKLTASQLQNAFRYNHFRFDFNDTNMDQN